MLNNPSSSSAHLLAFPSFDQCQNGEISLAPNAPILVIQANQKRAYAVLINNSENDITLILGESSSGGINKGIILKPYGSFEVTYLNLFLGKINAISKKNAKLSFVECSRE